jgi:acetyl-CoA carboxylase biotin carboxylase subunit
MRRALDEYVVSGIATTIPFFAWLLAQPQFEAGDFHTTSLDEILQARAGQPFSRPSAEIEEVAVIAAALDALLPAADGGRRQTASTQADSRWKDRARLDALEGLVPVAVRD